MAKQDITIEVFYDGAWHEVGGRPTRGAIQIDWGKLDPLGEPTPSALSMALDYRNGDLNPKNPASPLYGKAGKNTPTRVTLRPHETTGPHADARDTFARTVSNEWGSADQGGPWSMTTAGGSNAWFSVSDGAGRHDVANANAYALSSLRQLDVQDVEVAVTVACPQATGASLEPANIALRAISITDYVLARVEITTANAVTLRVFDADDNELGSATVAGLTHAGTGAPLRVKARSAGQYVMMKAWVAAGAEPAGWQLTVVDPNPRPGWLGIRSGRATGNTNTAGPQFAYTDLAVVVEDIRCTTEIAELRPRRTEDFTVDGGRGDAWVDVVAGGVLRRVGKGTDPRSALWRFLTSTDPIAYWPMEDGRDSTLAASGIVGGPPLTIRSGVIDFEDGGPPGSDGYAAVVQTPRNVLSADLPAGPDNEFRVGFWAKGIGTGAFGAYDEVSLVGITTSTGYTVRMGIANAESDAVSAYAIVLNPAGSVVGGVQELASAVPPPGRLDGSWHAIYAALFPDTTPGNIVIQFYVDGGFVGQNIFAAADLGYAQSIRTPEVLSDFEDAEDIGIDHLVVSTAAIGSGLAEAGLGWPGEPAAVRITNVAANRGVGVVVVGDPFDSQAMGPQYPDTTLNLFAEAERTDSGLLVDTRDALTLTYRTGRSMYAQTPALELDFTDGSVMDPLEPVLGDRDTRNDVTVNRREGSSAQAVQEVGPNNVQDPADDPEGVGRTVATIDINPASDDVLPHHAAWWLSIGVVDEITFARVTINADALPGLAAKVSAVRAGDLIVIDNVPSDLSPDLARLIVIGGKERIDTDERTVTFNCVPASPYDVGVWNQYPTPVSYTFDSTSDGWAGEAGAVVARVTSPVHDGAGALQATRTMGAGFASIRINDAGQIPDDISGGGPMLAVWALVPGGAAGTDWAAHIEVQDDTFTWRSGPNKALTPGAWALLTWEPPAELLSNCRAVGVQFEANDVNASQAVYIDTVHSAAPASATRYDTKLSTTSGTFTAGTDTSLTVASTGGVLWTTNPARYPIDLDLLGARVRALACSGASSPQTMTIDSTVVNGVSKIIPSGAPVRLWRKRKYGL